MSETRPRVPVISLGAGVQSTALVLMAARGEVEAQLAIFADTGAEPLAVYEHLDWLEAEVAGRVEIVRVAEVDLRAELEAKFNPVPLYMVGADGKPTIGRRQCTKVSKLYPIRHELRRRGYGPKRPVSMLLGITLDEIARMKPSGLGWVENAWPLIDLRLTRHDCLLWMERAGYPLPPRSACTFCPYRSDADWRDLRDTDPEGWADALEVDERAQARGEFVHRTCIPLADVDLTTPADHGQLGLLEQDECEGGCFL